MRAWPSDSKFNAQLLAGWGHPDHLLVHNKPPQNIVTSNKNNDLAQKPAIWAGFGGDGWSLAHVASTRTA